MQWLLLFLRLRLRPRLIVRASLGTRSSRLGLGQLRLSLDAVELEYKLGVRGFLREPLALGAARAAPERDLVPPRKEARRPARRLLDRVDKEAVDAAFVLLQSHKNKTTEITLLIRINEKP